MYEHLALLVRNRIKKYGEKVVFRFKQSEKWNSITWKELGEQMDHIAKALIEYGLPELSNVGIFSQNMPEWTVSDLAIYSIRGVSVPIFATNTAEQAEYIINEAEISLIFVGEQEQYDKIISISGKSKFLKNIVIFDNKVIKSPAIPSFYFSEFLDFGKKSGKDKILQDILSRVSIDDLASLIYTSGTTGEPKGVMLNHSSFIHAIKIHDLRLKVSQKDISLSFLPLSHIFERTWVYYVLHRGIVNNYLRDPKKIMTALHEVRPTLMCVVPRFFEKSYNGAMANLENSSSFKRKIFLWAIEVGKNVLHKRCSKEKISFGLSLKHLFADKVILKTGRAAFGGRINFMPCAGAALSPKIIEFFQACGINLIYGYGLTETTATVSCFEDQTFNIKSAGSIMPTIEVKINESNNEIYIKGGTVMQGYYKKTSETTEVFEDGWFKTGDAGRIDENGYLIMTERIKDIIKTSGGKFIAPQYIENVIGCDPYIDQIAIIGDDRKFLTALIVPSYELLNNYALLENIETNNIIELINHDKIKKFFSKRIDSVQSPLADFQKIKKFELLPNLFSQEGGELTPSLKIKRKVIADKYKALIETMYAEK